jgi:hypothetical protein
MHSFFKLLDSKPKDQFKVDYPYYGLFGTAEVTMENTEEVRVYKCRLRNGETVVLQKVHQKWIDTILQTETPLSHVIGNSIDDFLKK